MSEYHVPVLLNESVSALNIEENRNGIFVDATFGGGGHSREILARLGEKGKLIAFDRDSDAIANAPKDKRLILIHNNFRFVQNFTRALGFIGKIVYVDLGGLLRKVPLRPPNLFIKGLFITNFAQIVSWLHDT